MFTQQKITTVQYLHSTFGPFIQELRNEITGEMKQQYRKKPIIFTNGCFDILHYGHICLLELAFQYGILVVAVNCDFTVKEVKPNRPIINESARLRTVAALQFVSFVLLMAEPTPHKLLEVLQPDFLAKGDEYSHDQVVGHEVVESYGGKILRLPMTLGFSTSLIEERILQCHQKSQSSATT